MDMENMFNDKRICRNMTITIYQLNACYTVPETQQIIARSGYPKSHKRNVFLQFESDDIIILKFYYYHMLNSCQYFFMNTFHTSYQAIIVTGNIYSLNVIKPKNTLMLTNKINSYIKTVFIIRVYSELFLCSSRILILMIVRNHFIRFSEDLLMNNFPTYIAFIIQIGQVLKRGSGKHGNKKCVL